MINAALNRVPGDHPQAAVSDRVADVFHRCFADQWAVELRGGAAEPLYRAQPGPGLPALILFRDDFVNSALHEIAHWCIAGPARRAGDDYGYWYAGDQRDRDAQQIFEAAEVAPQALECLFAYACALPFRVSSDNLTIPDYDNFGFRLTVWQRLRYLQRAGLGDRADMFCRALAREFGVAGDWSRWRISLDDVG